MGFEIDWVLIHLVTLATTAVAILYADHIGFGYMRGTRQYLDHSLTVLLHRIVWVGLIMMIISGVFLTYPYWNELKGDPMFQLKMGLVAVLFLNSFAIGKLSKVTSTQSFDDLSFKMKMTLLLSGALSVTGWIGTTLIGFLYF